MIRAAVFDMDGLLIDSEPCWAQAEMEVFATVGIALTPAGCRQSTGLSLSQVVAWRHHQHPWSNKTIAQVEAEIHQRVVALIRSRARLLPGALGALAQARDRGLLVALATSSDPEILRAVLEVSGIESYFDHLQSASSLPHAKPHPAVYLAAAEALGVPPLSCVAFEDSLAGLLSAKAARMKAIAVPFPDDFEDARFSLADLRLSSLEQLTSSAWDFLDAI